ncbi:hypothetical protein TPAU25S_03490 [Tsukamurella paurometabola]|uniref:DUF2470 domain-containing protein n=1 Tax=Tsukamurella paurometabola (strain ATCC 8368 / DSM 20162 / CCUG 35730 / CIP 100753 / JCM 10117 / KCTC 9821 / NBRC 16120 / NCIMB 702349 / NCTC 13040) TaxID=521096 RepID=D5UQ28_TSUPD|nr:DUF2470 domain-containing protein [Tsukamurella paurometabola]ADG76796.1 conserved hypothetical protein [Tsukamurella paurometabola DSM 20162]SUP41671.1 Uncharacterised protein [Tsukamurella paurometabola]
MSAPTIAEPTPAERVRTVAVVPHAAVLVADGHEPITIALHHVLGDRLVIAVADDTPWLDGARAMVEINDISPLALRERTRSLVWLSGNLSEVADGAALAARVAIENPLESLLDVGNGSRLLTMPVETAVLADTAGASSVSGDELAAADPDPFAGYEAAWLAHVENDHPEMVGQLARRIPGKLRNHRIRLLGIDRFGIRLRAEHHELSDVDVRLNFAQPATDMAALQRGIRILLGCPFLNGLRAAG